ncbi:hypothetical protein O4H26_09665 [Aequorivita viscosa]|nr:hypothetical protein [Aequorivita viscosa]
MHYNIGLIYNMSNGFYIVILLIFTVLFSSCATTTAVKADEEVAGYNLKSKKEQMHSKILPKKNKSIIATP